MEKCMNKSTRATNKRVLIVRESSDGDDNGIPSSLFLLLLRQKSISFISDRSLVACFFYVLAIPIRYQWKKMGFSFIAIKGKAVQKAEDLFPDPDPPWVIPPHLALFAVNIVRGVWNNKILLSVWHLHRPRQRKCYIRWKMFVKKKLIWKTNLKKIPGNIESVPTTSLSHRDLKRVGDSELGFLAYFQRKKGSLTNFFVVPWQLLLT